MYCVWRLFCIFSLLYFQFCPFPLTLIRIHNHFWLFSQNIQPNFDWTNGYDSTKGRKNIAKKTFFLPWLRENRLKESEMNFFYTLHRLEKLMITVIRQGSCSRNVRKFLETPVAKRNIIKATYQFHNFI